jgi:hypothetical protein
MTDIEKKALALVNEFADDSCYELDDARFNEVCSALRRAIEQHEAFKQEVSDAAEEYNEAAAPMGWEGFDRFIIISKPDPLVDVFGECDDGTWETKAEYADKFRAALEARGLEIREKGQC